MGKQFGRGRLSRATADGSATPCCKPNCLTWRSTVAVIPTSFGRCFNRPCGGSGSWRNRVLDGHHIEIHVSTGKRTPGRCWRPRTTALTVEWKRIRGLLSPRLFEERS